MNEYIKEDLETIEHLNGEVYTYIHDVVLEELKIVESKNGGKFPNAVSKTMYKKILNEVIVKILVDGDHLKNIMDSARQEETFCKYCTRTINDFTNYIMITEFMKRGCTYCF